MVILYSSLLDVKVLYIDPKEVRQQFMRTINDPEYQRKYPLDVAFIKTFNFVTLDVRKKKTMGYLIQLYYLMKQKQSQRQKLC